MNNLKRVLSLALTGAMLVGTMLVGASAVNGKDFTDKAEIKHTEAVDTLVTLNVINGKDDGSYDPNGSLTRAEMAKLIVYALNGGKEPVMSTKATPTYSDIKGHWAEKYIEYCSNLGIIAGRGDGTFDPAGVLTGSQAAKMMLVAMNYKADVFGFTGADWELNVNAEANKAGLYKDLLGMDPAATISRDAAAQLVYNGILANTMTLTWGQNMSTGAITQNYQLTGAPLFAQKFDGESYEGILTASGKWAMSGTNNKDDFKVQLKKKDNVELTSPATTGYPALDSSKTFKWADQDLTALGGQYVKVLYNKGNKTVYGVYAVADKNTVVTSTTDNVEDVKADSIKIDGTVYDTDGLSYSGNDAWADNVTFIDNDGDDALELAIVEPVSVYKVSYVGTDTVTLGDKIGNYAESSLSNKLSDIIAYDGMKKDDMVIGSVDRYTGKMKLVKADVLQSTVSGYRASNGTYQIEGSWMTNQSGKTLALGNNLDYVAIGGVIYYAKVTSGATDVTNMTMVLTTGSDINGNQAKLLFSDGSSKVVYLASDTAAASCGKLFTFEVNNSGEYKLAAVPTAGTTGDAGKIGSYTVTATNAITKPSSSTLYAGQDIADDAVVFLFKGQVGATSAPTNAGKIITGKELKALGIDTSATTQAAAGADVTAANAKVFQTGTAAFTKATNGITKVAVAAVALKDYPASTYKVEWPTVSSSANYGFIVAAPYQTTIDGSKHMVYKVWNGTDTVDYKVKTDSATPVGVKNQVIGYDIVDASTIKNLSLAGTTSTAVKGLNGTEISFTDAVNGLSAGSVGKLDGNTKYLYVNTAAETADEIGVVGGSVQQAIQANTGIYVKNVLAKVGTDGKTVDLLVVDVNNKMALQSSEKSALTITGTVPTGYTITVDGKEYASATGTSSDGTDHVVKPGDIVKISRAADAVAVAGLTVSDTTLTTGNTTIPAAGQSVTYVADGSALTITFGAAVATSDVSIYYKADGTTATSSDTTVGGATKTVAVNVTAGVTSVKLNLANSSAQTVSVSGTDAGKVTVPTTASANMELTVNTTGATSPLSFSIVIAETGKTSITYNVTLTVAA